MFDFWSVLGVRDGVVAVAIDQGGYPQSCRAVETSWQFLLEMIRIRHNTVSTVEKCSCITRCAYVAEGDAKFEQIVGVEGFFFRNIMSQQKNLHFAILTNIACVYLPTWVSNTLAQNSEFDIANDATISTVTIRKTKRIGHETTTDQKLNIPVAECDTLISALYPGCF